MLPMETSTDIVLIYLFDFGIWGLYYSFAMGKNMFLFHKTDLKNLFGLPPSD